MIAMGKSILEMYTRKIDIACDFLHEFICNACQCGTW